MYHIFSQFYAALEPRSFGDDCFSHLESGYLHIKLAQKSLYIQLPTVHILDNDREIIAPKINIAHKTAHN
uniref:Uncharacterized protein n=1 Tax=Arion vulgaris TaxID=1028688 RepID=A0A0B7BBX4_9EUPU